MTESIDRSAAPVKKKLSALAKCLVSVHLIVTLCPADEFEVLVVLTN
jgi:biotin synthase-related radical SAM superfamily protein